MEIWKDIPGYNGLYQASSEGRIKSFHRGSEKIKKPTLSKIGYLVMTMSLSGRKTLQYIHDLILLTFKGEKGDLISDHINNIKTDNRELNLQYITQRLNNSKDRIKKSKLPTGVFVDRKKYRAEIRIKSKKYYLGKFLSIEEASSEYQKALSNVSA